MRGECSCHFATPKSASEPFISKGTAEHASNCEFLLKTYRFPSFWKSLTSAKPTYTPTLSAIYALTISDRGQGSLNAVVSENTLPFVSQSINNFSDYDISQSLYLECPSLSPHVLLLRYSDGVVINATIDQFPCPSCR